MRTLVRPDAVQEPHLRGDAFGVQLRAAAAASPAARGVDELAVQLAVGVVPISPPGGLTVAFETVQCSSAASSG
jgi:hypothetical protein